jgi:hypothetical protein
MKLQVKKGTTSKRIFIAIRDSSSTTGAYKTGLTSSNLLASYSREDDGNAGATAISLSAGTRGTWSSGGIVEKDSSAAKGDYELGIPNAALVAGSNVVTITVYDAGSNNVALLKIEIQLVDYDPQDSVRLGLTALPNAPANAAGGLPVSIAGALDLDEMNADIEAIQTGVAAIPTSNPTPAAIATAVWQDATPGDFTAGSSIGKSLYTSGIVPGVSGGLFIAGSNAATAVNFTGNLSGSVGSVTAGVTLAAGGLDPVLIESGIVASASLTNDAAAQLTSINARQALALIMSSAAAGVLAGAATTTVTTKPGGLPAGNTRITATVDVNGNRSALVLVVPT